MPKRSESYMLQRREEVLDALARCIRKKGITETAMTDVVRESGMSTGAVYSHFRSKDQMLLALIERNTLRFDSGFFFERFASSTDFWEIIDHCLARYRAAKGLALGVLTMELMSLARQDAKIRAQFLSSLQAWRAFLARGVALLPEGKAVIARPELLETLVGGLLAVINDLDRQILLGVEADTAAARRQIELLVVGAQVQARAPGA